MRIVYIAGPFRAPNLWEQEQNIRRAEGLALQVWRSGAAALCPHTNTRFFQGAAPDEVWLEGDLAMLELCDAVLLVAGWEDSSGARVEVARAEANNVPVFQTLEELRAWL